MARMRELTKQFGLPNMDEIKEALDEDFGELRDRLDKMITLLESIDSKIGPGQPTP